MRLLCGFFRSTECWIFCRIWFPLLFVRFFWKGWVFQKWSDRLDYFYNKTILFWAKDYFFFHSCNLAQTFCFDGSHLFGAIYVFPHFVSASGVQGNPEIIKTQGVREGRSTTPLPAWGRMSGAGGSDHPHPLRSYIRDTGLVGNLFF